jgi:hypothetical protein
MSRQFLGKARGYMLGYHHQALEAEDGREEVKSFEQNEKIVLTGMHFPFLVNSSHR